MPLCGFDKKMIDGITKFSEGLRDHGLVERSSKSGISLDEQLERELAEMEAFLAHVDSIADKNMRDVVIGLTRQARGYFRGSLILRMTPASGGGSPLSKGMMNNWRST